MFSRLYVFSNNSDNVMIIKKNKKSIFRVEYERIRYNEFQKVKRKLE